MVPNYATRAYGGVAEWSCSGLQSRLRRFDSDPSLQLLISFSNDVFEDLASETLEFEGQRIKVATPETLLKMKKDTLREKDKADAVFLRKLIETKKRKG